MEIPDFHFDVSAAGIKLDINENTMLYDVFKHLWTDDVEDLLLKCSNICGDKLSKSNRPKQKNCRSKNFPEIKKGELDRFIGLTLLRAQIGFPELRKAFSHDPVYYHPFFSRSMSGRRYEQIVRCFCCYEKVTQDKLYKISPLLERLLKNFQDAYAPEEHLSLDESMLLFRERLSFRMYVKNKKAKYGIKFFKLCAPNGYVFNIEIYKGKQETISKEPKLDSDAALSK
nr:unnamed protein product [Callosobruchus analis]